jgi:hypothetical protein
LLSDVRREHPHLRLSVIADALAANAPNIRCQIENETFNTLKN